MDHVHENRRALVAIAVAKQTMMKDQGEGGTVAAIAAFEIMIPMTAASNDDATESDRGSPLGVWPREKLNGAAYATSEEAAAADSPPPLGAQGEKWREGKNGERVTDWMGQSTIQILGCGG
jgi:hypothetical protein